MHRTGGPLFVKGEGVFGQGNGPDEVLNHNNPDPDQPGLWCQWTPSDDGLEIEWDEGEKFYYAPEWMEYIVNKLLSPAAKSYVAKHVDEDERLQHFTCNHIVDGEIYANGEDGDDVWKLKVTNNKVEVLDGQTVYGDEGPPPPTEEELREALRSLGAQETTRVRVWTVTVDDANSIVTMALGSEEGCYTLLKENYTDAGGEDPDFDLTSDKGCSRLIEYLTEHQGLVLYIEEHDVEVPA